MGYLQHTSIQDKAIKGGDVVALFPERAGVPRARPIRFGNLFSVEVVWPSGATQRIPNAFYMEMATAAMAARSMNWAWKVVAR